MGYSLFCYKALQRLLKTGYLKTQFRKKMANGSVSKQEAFYFLHPPPHISRTFGIMSLKDEENRPVPTVSRTFYLGVFVIYCKFCLAIRIPFICSNVNFSFSGLVSIIKKSLFELKQRP